MKVFVNTLKPRRYGRHFPDYIFKWIFLYENLWIPIEISLKFVPRGPSYNIPALVQIMAWRRPGDKPLSEPMIISLLTHICVTRPQWVNAFWAGLYQRFAHREAINTFGLLTPHAVKIRNWLRQWLGACNQAIAWTNASDQFNLRNNF